MTVFQKEIGPQRYRESFGRYYEDFEVGDVYEHRPGRTLTESDNTWFTLLTMNQHPLHFDKVYAAKSEFGQPLVNSCLTLSIVVGMSVSDLSQKVVANLGWENVRLTAPVFIGDTLYAESEILNKRESKSRPTQGIVTARTAGRKSDGTVVIDLQRSFLAPKRACDVYEHRPGRTLTESDNTWFTLLTMNQHPLHFDKVYAAKSEFGQPLVNSCLTLSIVVGMSVSDLSQKVVANLGWENVRLTAPVFIGDTLYAGVGDPQQARIQVAPHAGDRHRAHRRAEPTNSSDGTVVIDLQRSFLAPKRGHAVDDLART